MAQILVLTDAPGHTPELLLSEHLDSVHVESGHSAGQLIERLAWAVRDAERAERLAALRVVSRRPGASAASRSTAAPRSRRSA
jgi:hypothetical protein